MLWLTQINGAIKQSVIPKISIPPPPQGRDWYFLGVGVLKDQKFKEIISSLIGIPRGVGGFNDKSLLWGRYMDILWNYTTD